MNVKAGINNYSDGKGDVSTSSDRTSPHTPTGRSRQGQA